MGNLTSQPIYLALQELLHSKGLKLEKGQEVLEQLKEKCSMISEKDSSEESSSNSEEELELLMKKMERSYFRKCSESCEVEPTAPGPAPPPYNITSSPGGWGGSPFARRVTAAFTTAQVEALNRHCMTPSDWMSLVGACLSSGQYLDWKAFLIEYANEQAVVNRAAGNAAWDMDMLLGQG
ncbi:hypothetical protein NN561_005594 [Cricetulus griseus]